MSPLGWIHTSFALVAIASGAVVLLRRKGTPAHRRMGWVYVASMLVLNGTALSIQRLFGGFGPFHALALLSLATVAGGIVVALRRRSGWVARHYRWMAGSYVGLLAAAASEASVRLPGTPFWGAVLAATAIVVAVGVVLIRARAEAVLAPFGGRGGR